MENISSLIFSKKATFIGLLVTVLFVFAGADVNAQGTAGKSITNEVPQGNFVNVSEAITRLDSALENLKVSMSSMDPNSDAYKSAELKYLYFENIRAILDGGKGTDAETVANAIASAVYIPGAGGSLAAGPEMKDLYPFKVDAINLLKQ